MRCVQKLKASAVTAGSASYRINHYQARQKAGGRSLPLEKAALSPTARPTVYTLSP